MVGAADKFPGWTVTDAVERCVDPDLLSRWVQDHRDWVKGGRRKGYTYLSEKIDGDAAVRHNERERATHSLYLQERSSHARLLRSLRDLLRAGNLVAWGRRDSPLSSSLPIPQSAWNYLRISNSRKSIAVETTKAKTNVFEIRIFPVVDAPDAIDRLDGKTFVEAFQMCVADDPQVAVLNKRAASAGDRPVPFGCNYGPIHAAWSVVHGRECAGESPIGFLNTVDFSTQYNREITAQGVIGRRFASLIDFLAAGRMEAEAIPAGGGNSVPLPRSIWRRRHTYLDLVNGDILEFNSRADDHTTALTGPTFTGLMLSRSKVPIESPKAVSPDQEEAVAAGKSLRKVVSNSKAEADCTKWLSGLMRTSPTKKARTKDECKQQAQTKWPQGLGDRAFERAWRNAILLSDAPAWSASGRPAKSRRS